ncbi:MAG: GNAT family N-acetyltransferase [Clostridia bacterium]|nr:GNAT family N-acetyltransferase [Clostridia bacterium]
MRIRRAEQRDADKIKDLLNQVLTVHYNGRPDLFKSNCRKYDDDELNELIKNDMRPIFVAEEKVVLGYAFCVIKENRNHNMTDIKTLYIDDLCVDENARGQHVGTVLYEYVKEYARTIGCYNLTLNVWACNESTVKFYEKLGLKPQSTMMETIL